MRQTMAFPSLFEINLRVDADGQALFFEPIEPLNSVFVAPVLASGRRNLQIKSATIVKTIGFILALCVLDYQLSQHATLRAKNFKKIR